jgi:hypothetical protein
MCEKHAKLSFTVAIFWRVLAHFLIISHFSGQVAEAPSYSTRPLQDLLVCCYKSHVTRPTSLITHHTSHVTRHTSHLTRHTSHATRHTPHATRHTPHATRHTSHVTRHTPHATRHTPHVTRHTPLVTRHTPHATRHTPHATRHTPHATRHTSPLSLRFVPDVALEPELKGFLPLGDPDLSLVSTCTEEPNASWTLSLKLQSSARAYLVMNGRTVTSSGDLKLMFNGPHAREICKVFFSIHMYTLKQ